MASLPAKLNRKQAIVSVKDFVAYNATTLHGAGIDQAVFAQRCHEAVLFSEALDRSDVEASSLRRAIRKACQTGLVPDGEEAALIPFLDKRKGTTRIEFVPMWKGLAKLAWQTLNAEIDRDIVYDGDRVRVIRGAGVAPVLEIESHPFQSGERKPIGAWASMHIRGNDRIAAEEHPRYVILDMEDLQRAQQKSAKGSRGEGPWASDWKKMALKTAVKHLIQEVGYMFLAQPERFAGLNAAFEADREFDSGAETVDVPSVEVAEPEAEKPKPKPRRKKAAPEPAPEPAEAQPVADESGMEETEVPDVAIPDADDVFANGELRL